MQKKAFTLTEILVVIAIVGILGTVALPEMGKAIDRAKAAKIYRLAEALESACESYFNDNNQYATEFDSNCWQPWCSPTLFTLTQQSSNANQGDYSWKGPYLKRPLMPGDNPFLSGLSGGGDDIYVWNNLSNVTFNGFDFNGDGVIDRNGSGNVLILKDFTAKKSMLTPRRAKIINDLFDYGVFDPWEKTGRVIYDNSTSTIYIYLFGGDLK